MPRDLKGWARLRPFRVAFLIEDGEYANLALDGIFADSYNRWGGRFSLIAPCINGRIAPNYWPWLEAYDPDIVYSYVPLNRADVLEVHERLSPALYAFHKLDREPRLDAFGFKPSYQLSSLSSLSVIFRLARYRPAAGAPLKIIDSWHTEKPSQFLTDNFGTYHLSRGGGIYPPDAAAAASLLTIVSPEKQADHRYGKPEFLAVLGELLNRRNHVNAGSGGQPQLTIRSASLSAEQLAEAHQLVLSAKSWSVLTTEAVAGVDDIVPSAEALQNAIESSRFGGDLFARPDWTRFMWSPPTARPPASVPDHLSDAPVRQAFTGGYWCTDFIFEYEGPGPRMAPENRWMLPRRWRMAGAFKASLVGEPLYVARPYVRRSRDGNLAILVSTDHPVETILVPTAYEAMKYALAADGAMAEPDAEHERALPPSKVVWTEPSNEARYLTGVLGMTGGLGRADDFLLHPFLLETLAKLGGTPNLPADKVTPTVNRLRKRAQREAAFDLKVEGERQALAHLIVKAARMLKTPMDFVSYNHLKASWKAYRATYWAAVPPEHRPNPDVAWDKHEEESLDACLIELRRRQIVFQGHQWTCRECHHRNWVDFAALSPELSCEVCKQPTQVPIDIPWLFRPNEFLIESLRDHSVLSLVWVLSALRQKCRRSLIFIGPTWFGFTNQSSSPDAEADLLVILDGRALLCAVKSSWHGLRRAHIADFIELARRLRPDTALLAVMEAGRGPENDLAAARAQLATERIEFELLTPDAYRPGDVPYLHFNDEK
jgi:hypothetical protein